jgi:DNA-binding NtrC family response regulator
MRRHSSILVIDDEEVMREVLDSVLSAEGHRVTSAESAEAGLALARATSFDAVVLDVMLPGMDGIQALQELKRLDEELPVVMVTAVASVETALTAMKKGAFDYITKPFKNDEVAAVVGNAVERRQLIAENAALRQSLQAQARQFSGIIGRSARMKQVLNLIAQAAPSRSTILITGESGTGKELVARAIHANSSRNDRAFVTVNSGNLPPDLLESTLFGHVKGAFTGAISPKRGLCDLADKGTIFFDEIGNIAADTQAKLLRLIQEREFMRLGGMETIKVDARIVAATNRPLEPEARAGRFRHDLRYRLDVLRIVIPPLRDRIEDLPLLVRHIWSRLAERTGSRAVLSPAVMSHLGAYDWPGNVRELQNVLASMMVAGPARGVIGPHGLPAHITRTAAMTTRLTLAEARRAFEERYVRAALARAGGRSVAAARELGVSRQGLRKLTARLGLSAIEEAAGATH